MRLKYLALPALLAALASTPALAQKPEDAIKYRQGVYKVIGWNFGPMAAMVKGDIPYDKEGFARRAANVEFVSKLAIEGFTPGSDKADPKVDTKAKPELWAKMDDFRGKMTKMNEEVTKLAAISRTGSFDDIKKQFGATGAACKACHDDYRAK